MNYDSIILILLFLSVLITIIAQVFVNHSFNKYKKIANSKNLTGFDVAREILDQNKLNDVLILETSGILSDHYDPSKKVIKLSRDIYNGKSISALAVSAHEVGHAIQDKEGYSFLKTRTKIFPIVNLASKFGYFAIMIGLIFNLLNLVWLGIILECFILFFQIITLPVEFDASKKALFELEKNKLVKDSELEGSRQVLKAAALTYVASVLTTLLELLRLVLIGLGRDDR